MSLEFPRAVLFACNMNTIRSPMAAALLRHHSGGRIYAASAGVQCGLEDPFTSTVMREVGLDLSEHHPHTFEALGDTNFDLIVSLTPEAHARAAALTRFEDISCEYWPMPDPTEETGSREMRLAAYRDLRARLSRRIADRFPVSTFAG